jgi:prophage antirepressor-like protein
MIEEIKYDNNCIVKAFENNPIAILQENDDIKKVYYFKASDIAKALNIINIHSTIQNFEENDEKVIRKAYDLRGVEQDTTFLTSQGVYRLLYNSKKEIAKKFRKWAGNILDDIIFNESIELKRQLKEQQKVIEQKEQDNILDRHNLLLTRYAKTGSIVYFIKVKSFDDNNSFILKIGQSSIGLEPRYAKHKISYPECIILDCFKVDKALDLELFIHNAMRKSLYTTLQGHENEKELFLIESEDQYNNLINLVSENIKRFNNSDYVEISDLQKEINRLQNNQNNVPDCPKIDSFELKKILDNQEKMLALITRQMCNLEKLENTLQATINNSNSRTSQEYNTIIKPLQGPKVIQINSDNLQIYKIHNTIIDLLKLNPHISRNSLKKSVENNTVYKNYRWMFLNRDFEIKDIVIIPTKLTETRDVGYIAKLNPDKTKIINVFYSMTEAIKINGSISRNDPYYIIYDKCDINLKENFEEIYGEPLLYKNGLGQFDTTGVNLIKDFASKQDCLKKSNISRALLDKLIKDQSIYNGFIYRFIGKKSQFLN